MALLLSATLAAQVSADDVIPHIEQPGHVTFVPVTNAVSYRVEWSVGDGGTWTTFNGSAGAWLDNIPGAGSGPITASVPILYRVVAEALAPPAGMALIPAGLFLMGATTNVGHESSADERPQHAVSISAFYMDVHEVTKALWDEVKAFNGGNGYFYTYPGSGKGTNHPVHLVNWFDAVKWCNARSQRDGLSPVYFADANFTIVYKTGESAPYVQWSNNGYRLPTEAEWEKAARGGLPNLRYPWSDSDEIQHARANYQSDGLATYDTSPTRGTHPTYTVGLTPYTSPVGSFAPNDYGIYDLAGNQYEWCWDWYVSTYYITSPAADPRGPDTGSFRVYRGGSWNGTAYMTRVARRGGNLLPTTPGGTIGFRCVRGP